jgi:ComEC/Rec2-related protein
VTTRIISIGLGYIVGIVLVMAWDVSVPHPVALALCAVGLALSIGSFVRERRWKPMATPVICLAALLFAVPLGVWRTSIAQGSATTGSLAEQLNEFDRSTSISLRGVVCEEPEILAAAAGDLIIDVDALRVGKDGAWQTVAGRVKVSVRPPRGEDPEEMAALDDLLHPDAYGYRAEVSTRYRPAYTPANPGEFDYGAFLFRSNLVTHVYAYGNSATIIERSTGHPVVELALKTKERFIASYRATVRDPASRLVSATTLGTRRAVKDLEYKGRLVEDSFRHAGVGHILAVSGLHVSIISLLIYVVLSMTGMKPRTFTPALLFFLLIYTLLTGARPSSVRAAIMNSSILLVLAYFPCNLRKATFVGLALSSFFILLRNPLTLVSASFLLSFGAVLSLVMIAPPLDKYMCRLRGWSLIWGCLWFAAVFWLCCVDIGMLARPYSLTFIIGLLWLGVCVGARLNEQSPAMWHVGFDRIPPVLRMFLAAQLAIQFGMMIPMSAWFFGQFPVAGMLVNLVAIPFVGVLVQLGMLTAVLGLIPGIGVKLAAPLGATCTLLAVGFFWFVDASVSLFPFPTIPKPTLSWMVGYYIALALLLLLDKYLPAVQSRLYDAWRRLPVGSHRQKAVVWGLPVAMVLIGACHWLPREAALEHIDIYSAGNAPVISLVDTGKRAVLINCGDSRAAERVVFEGLRTRRATDIETAVITGPDPRLALEGIATLVERTPVRLSLLNVLPETPEGFVAAIGDDYMAGKLAAGEKWAVRYADAYAAFDEALKIHGGERALFADGPEPVAAWSNAVLHVASPPTEQPRRFVSSANTRIVSMQTGGVSWIVVSDSSPYVVKTLSKADILVLPDLSYRKGGYDALIDEAVKAVQPQLVIVCGSSTRRTAPVRERIGLAGYRCTVLLIAEEGAIHATPSLGTLVLNSRLTGRETVITPGVAAESLK